VIKDSRSLETKESYRREQLANTGGLERQTRDLIVSATPGSLLTSLIRRRCGPGVKDLTRSRKAIVSVKLFVVFKAEFEVFIPPRRGAIFGKADSLLRAEQELRSRSLGNGSK
jgi:hypothetical protein